MKTIALFGLTGRTGKPLAELLLSQGYTIRALVRNPDAVKIKHPNLLLLQGNVLVKEDVERTIDGTEAFVSVLGHVRSDKQRNDMQTIATEHILAAMAKHGVKRIISLTGGAVSYKDDKPKLVDKAFSFVMGLVAKNIVADAVAHASRIAASSTEWTIVRAPRILEAPPKGTYRVGLVGVNTSTTIAYGDLAAFIAKELTLPEHVHSMPFVSY
jgi:putative NADH-flavin reductase